MADAIEATNPQPKSQAVVSIITDKAALLKWRTKHDLHVLMLMEKHGLTKIQASVQAYYEGIEGLNKRLG